MTQNGPAWDFVALLHNLPVTASVGNDCIAIVPASDNRLAHLTYHTTFQTFVSRFTDQFGVSIRPGVLIVRADLAPVPIELITAFRNCLAIAAISQAWENYLGSGAQLQYFKYSDHFAIYPYSLSKEDPFLVATTPSIGAADEVSNFHGQTSPAIAVGTPSSGFYDVALFEALMNHWNVRLESGPNWFRTTLFRSLEMAYRAGALPYENIASVEDYGTQIGLWISAFEILSRPENENANLKKVLSLLEKASFHNRRLNARRYKLAYRKKVFRTTLPGKLYGSMHKARNDFFHGNPIARGILHAFGRQNRPLLTSYAPILYKIAMYSFLGLWPKSVDLTAVGTETFFRIRTLEEALCSATKPSREWVRRQERLKRLKPKKQEP